MRMGNEIMDMINKCKDTTETEKVATSHQQEEILKKEKVIEEQRIELKKKEGELEALRS